MKLTKLIAVTVALSLTIFAGAVQATPVTLTRETTNPGWQSVAVDPATGKVYFRNGYFNNTAVTVYNNVSAFEAGTPSGSLNLANGGYWGTYFAVKNGVLFGRDSTDLVRGFPADARVSAWDTTTGNKIAGPVTIPGMGGVNGVDTYNWGGFSGVNINQDSTGLYVAGGVLNVNTWQVTKIDQSLNVLSTTTVSGASEGYGFVINGIYFASSNYNSNTIDIRVDLTSGVQTLVNYTLTGGPGNQYWQNASYDYASDTLRLGSQGSGVYMVSNASTAFNAPTTTQGSGVPAPGALALLGLGLLGLGGIRRKRAA